MTTGREARVICGEVLGDARVRSKASPPIPGYVDVYVPPGRRKRIAVNGPNQGAFASSSRASRHLPRRVRTARRADRGRGTDPIARRTAQAGEPNPSCCSIAATRSSYRRATPGHPVHPGVRDVRSKSRWHQYGPIVMNTGGRVAARVQGTARRHFHQEIAGGSCGHRAIRRPRRFEGIRPPGTPRPPRASMSKTQCPKP